MKNYKHFWEKEREIIFLGLQEWLNKEEIAKKLNRHPSSIWREIKRNSSLLKVSLNWTKEAKEEKENYHYLPDRANNKYKQRKKEAWKQRPILKWADFFYVVEYIKKWYSPEIISWRMREERTWNISHEAIYQFIYNKDFKHLKLWEYLPQRRKKRRVKTWRKGKRTLIPNRVDISLRAEEINNRSEIWHWEWDSIEWLRWTSNCLHVSIERYSRLTRIKKLEQKTALNTSLAMIDIMSKIPKEVVKSSTLDNGSEFTWWERVKQEIWLDVYFTHPYSSWEKWSVERINWFIRRFFPKKTDFTNITEEQIQEVEDWINNRPMTCLNFKTPNEVFQEELKKKAYL